MTNDRLTDIAYRHFIESVKDYAIYMLNPDGTVASWNEGARRAKGYTHSQITGKYFGLFYSASEQRIGLPAHNLAIARQKGKFEGEGWRYRRDGSRFWAHVIIDAIYDEQRNLLGFAKITRDISEQKEVMDKIAHLARYDALTSLPNRSESFNFIASVLTRGEYYKVAIFTIDLDKFKDINDLYGHGTGDQILQRAAHRAREMLGKNELIARFGGDEFVAVKPFNTPGEREQFTRRLDKCFNSQYRINGREIAISASIGGAVYPDDGADINMLISNADLAMHRAKADVDHNICWYAAEMDEKTRMRNLMSADICKGLAAGQFFMHYQGKRALRDNSITGYEALLRWRHPVYGEIPPDVFIPLAEESGAIIPLGYWVIEQVCRESLAGNIRKRISVNISPVQLRHHDFIENVREILKRMAYPLSLLEFEVTETAFIIDKTLTFNILRQFQKMGISIALDDFGTGYSSLSTLRDFRFDVIKLDRCFLENIETHPEARSFVRAIISLGKAINTPLVAEGVETQAQLRVLEEEGCTEIQGFLFGKPAGIASIQR